MNKDAKKLKKSSEKNNKTWKVLKFLEHLNSYLKSINKKIEYLQRFRWKELLNHKEIKNKKKLAKKPRNTIKKLMAYYNYVS